MSEPDSWCTIIPLVDLYIGLKTPVCFSGGFLLTPIPDLLRQDDWTERLSAPDRKGLQGLLYAFVVEYEGPPADTLASRAESPEAGAIQKAKHEIAQLANLAMWLARPSPVCFDLIFNAPRREGGWSVPFVEKTSRILCHPRDRGGLVSDSDLEEARNLHSALCGLPAESSIRTAVHACWSALQIEMAEVRYLLLWIALEALFAPEDSPTRGPDLFARRIVQFNSADCRPADDHYARARRAYLLKSRIAYGQRTEPADLAECGHETESLLRGALRKILSSDDLTDLFSGTSGREDFLKGLVTDNSSRPADP